MSPRMWLAVFAILAAPGLLIAGEAGRDQRVQLGIVESMSHHDGHREAHLKWTEPRPQTAEDIKRAESIAKALREAIEKYKDYRVATEEGYRPFLPEIPQPEYHFTNYWRGFLNAFTFNPARPTSLLYKKNLDGYELVGAMYTASRFSDEDELNKRVPLSVARWHAHVNICLPPRGQGATADWTKFGPRGSIATREECHEAGGRFRRQIFGWMVHVYPFAEDPERIWAH